jgi:hypothetical protein
MKSAIETISEEIATKINGSVQRPKPGGRFMPFGTQYSITGKFSGRSVAINLEPWGEVTLKCDCNANYRFRIRPNSFWARIGLLEERRVLTGDTEFNQSFVVRSNNYREIYNWLMRREIRELLFMLIPFSELAFRGNLLQYNSEIQLDRPRTNEILNKLKILNDIAISLETQY